ncbi:MAG TPA: DUF805 domain-containing protein [Steroidobacteraceae bacterium]|jgi:uncharacterized membrane protein YhaH (DUF805 family)|nr:DUF805 domain-containing protein [Steroidobacteraceae bacterium]
MNWYLEALRKYAVFEGRARRMEYWMFVLINCLIVVVLSVVDTVVGLFSLGNSVGALTGLYWLVVLVPSVAVTVRRLHDTDRSGWWALLALLPVLGTIVLFVFCVLDGTPGPNRFGENPKAVV